MARINGVDLPREKRVEIGLTYIYGIGRTTATKICVECNVNVDTRVKDLTEDEVNAIRDYIDKNQIMVEGERQAPYGHRLQPRPSSPQGPPGPRPAHPH